MVNGFPFVGFPPAAADEAHRHGDVHVEAERGVAARAVQQGGQAPAAARQDRGRRAHRLRVLPALQSLGKSVFLVI